jgi:hypothetical protein
MLWLTDPESLPYRDHTGALNSVEGPAGRRANRGQLRAAISKLIGQTGSSSIPVEV